MESLSLLWSFLSKADGSLGIVFGIIALAMHFYFRNRKLNDEERVIAKTEKNDEMIRLTQEIQFLVDENRKLRSEIIELRRIYVELHEQYLEVLEKLHTFNK